jgi:hypothetical protein
MKHKSNIIHTLYYYIFFASLQMAINGQNLLVITIIYLSEK